MSCCCCSAGAASFTHDFFAREALIRNKRMGLCRSIKNEGTRIWERLAEEIVHDTTERAISRKGREREREKEEMDFLTDATNGEVNPHGSPRHAGRGSQKGDEYGGGTGREGRRRTRRNCGWWWRMDTWIWMDGGGRSAEKSRRMNEWCACSPGPGLVVSGFFCCVFFSPN